MLFASIEFFAHETEIWVRVDGGAFKLMEENDHEVIDRVINLISTFYPKAYKALRGEYERCAPNKFYFNYRIASRFIRCNFAKMDNVPDITAKNQCNFEYVECPIRGECKHENVVCRPKFDSNLSPAELRVLRYWYEGETVDAIAELLFLSPHTVNNHIKNAYKRLKYLGINIREKADFVKYAEQNKLFK